MACSGAPTPPGSWSARTSKNNPNPPRKRRHDMNSNAALKEPRDLAACFAGQNAQELVVEMAHDLRSPLTSIMFLAEAMQRGQSGPINDTQRRQLGLIRSAALCLCA